MAERRFLGAGKFVWCDLMTTDVDRAVAYYTELFPWTLEEVDMGEMGTYKMIGAAGQNQGGFVPLDPAKGYSSHWLSYVTVDDVDETVTRATEIGGELLVEGTDIPNVGRFAVIQDPHGAAFAPFKGGHPDEEELAGPPAAGTFCWHQLLAKDPAGAAEFYGALLPWTIFAVDMGEMGTYHLLKRGGADAGGMLTMPQGAEGPSSWLPYVAVEDVDGTTDRVGELGGRIFVPPSDIPGVGRFSVTADPTGASIALYKPAAGE